MLEAPFDAYPGDIIVVPGFFAKFTRSPKEEPSYAGHLAYALDDDYTIEADWHVITKSLIEFDAEHPAYKVYRKKNISMDTRQALGRKMVEFSTKAYGAFKLLLHGADMGLEWLYYYISGRTRVIYFFRKLIKRSLPICHEIGTLSYWDVLKYMFGRPPLELDPDEVDDWMMNHPEDWELVFEKIA